jgi:hypothetical protein
MERAAGWWRRLTPRHLILLVPWIGIVIAAAKPIADNSFLWHVRAGTLQLDLGHVLTTDPFSFTMQGAPWRTQSWLIELGYGLLERWTKGLGWVRFELVIVAGVTYLLLALIVYRKSRNILATGLLMAIFTWLAVAFEVPRPVVFTGLFLVMLIALLDEDMLWPVPLLVWVWASVHGAWIIGIGYLVVHTLATRRPLRRRAATLGASLLAATVTAHGIGVWEILWAFLRNRKALSYISEWAIPNMLSIQNLPYVALFVLLMAAAIRGKLRLRMLWIIVPFFVFGLSAGRNLYPAMIVLLPLAVGGWPEQWRWRQVRPSLGEARLNLVVAALLLLAPIVPLVTAPAGISEDRFPIAALQYLGPGRVFTDDSVGGYLIYAQWPGREVLIDDRAELYGREFMKEFVDARTGSPVWQDIMSRYGITQALVKSDWGITRALEEAGWAEVYFEADGWTVLVERT